MSAFAKIENTLGTMSAAINEFLTDTIIPQMRAMAVLALAEPMIYSLCAPGKRLRGALVLLCAGMRAEPKANPGVFYLAVAVEALHTYSLIHDDLPAMDDSKLRRGKPACHIQYPEWAAILAGDGLHSFAFELLDRACQDWDGLDFRDLVLSLSRGAGISGMLSGQALDLSTDKTNSGNNAANLLHEIHNKKTAALFRSSCELGALVACCPSLIPYQNYGSKLGFLFQMQDDILDVCGDTQSMGKAVGKDINKVSYPAVFGLDKSKKQCQILQQELRELSSELVPGPNSQVSYQAELGELANFILQRDS